MPSKIKSAHMFGLSSKGYSQVEIAGEMKCSRKGVQTMIKIYILSKKKKKIMS